LRASSANWCQAKTKDLLVASAGLNLGVDFLPGALGFTAEAAAAAGSEFCANVVWLDALVMNLDRTPRNPNLLTWHGRTWLIDHGAALYPQHSPAGLVASAQDPFALIRDHVLLPHAGSIADADERLASAAREAVAPAVAAVPDEWVAGAGRDGIEEFFARRLGAPRAFAAEAEHARA
jgi:hypothetical protein